MAYAAASLEDGISALSKGTRKITFANCKLGDQGITEFVRTLKKHEDVTWLAFFDNEITDVSPILQALKGNKSIVHLDLGRNPIGDAGVKAICEFLATNRTLEELYLWETGMTDAGALLIDQMLHKNRVVRIVDINDNPDVKQGTKNNIAALLKQGPSRVPASPRAGPAKLQ